MRTEYFTFGQDHVHVVNGVTLDKDCVLRVISKWPRDTMINSFGRRWAGHYTELPDMSHYPRGVFDHWQNPPASERSR